MRSKELPVELRDRIVVETQIRGRVSKNFYSIEGSQEHTGLGEAWWWQGCFSAAVSGRLVRIE
jgi:hypothetical protein